MKTEIISLEEGIRAESLQQFFDSFKQCLDKLNEFLENKTGKAEAAKIELAEAGIRLQYEALPGETTGEFSDVTIQEDYSFEERIPFVQFFVFECILAHGCYKDAPVYGAMERGITAGFKFSMNKVEYNYVFWERPKVVYVVMRHAEKDPDRFDLTSKGYTQAKEVGEKLSALYPNVDWVNEARVSLPRGVIRITVTASQVCQVLHPEGIDALESQRLGWLGLYEKDSTSFAAGNLASQPKKRFELLFTHREIAPLVLAGLGKKLNVKSKLFQHEFELAECIIIDGKNVTQLLPNMI